MTNDKTNEGLVETNERANSATGAKIIDDCHVGSLALWLVPDYSTKILARRIELARGVKL